MHQKTTEETGRMKNLRCLSLFVATLAVWSANISLANARSPHA